MNEYIIFYGNRVSDMRIQDDKINTLQARMGTGGNNMPLVATTLRFRGGKPGGGKGPLLAESIAQSLTSTGDQRLFYNNVRRITPLECERLQGFPDNWTEGQADTHRYKQMGNAVVVPVAEWIIQNICDTV
jgi:DNA (cytosine-5)-methyltransferase 1